jgi:hypothetical protein
LFADPRLDVLGKTIRANQRSREAAGRDHWNTSEWRRFLGAAIGAGLKFPRIAAALRRGATDDEMAREFGTDKARERIVIRDGIEAEARQKRAAEMARGGRRQTREATVEADDAPFVLG